MHHFHWIYQANLGWVFLMILSVLIFTSFIAFELGKKVKEQNPDENQFYLSEFIPSTILGLLALIFGFTFSMAVGRFEHRRELAVSEANAIGTTYLRTYLLRSPHSKAMNELVLRHLDSRIQLHDPSQRARTQEIELNLNRLQKQIWSEAVSATQTDRGAIESIFINSLNSMIDVANERDIALEKTLPPVIYWAILLISSAGLMALSFGRSERREKGQWQTAILAFLISFVFCLILDIDRPQDGLIQISQDAMTALQKDIAQNKSE